MDAFVHLLALPGWLSPFAMLLDEYSLDAAPLGSTARSSAVQTSTPNPDGSLIHEVQPGESVWSIATAYGMKPDVLLEINHLSPSVVLWSGDKLVIQPSFTPTLTPAVTSTPVSRPQSPTHSPAPTRTATPMPTPTAPPPIIIFQGGGRHWLGVGMIAICILGLLMVVITALHRR